ncbi:universal stress protein [Nocardia abscessus]|uniref:universal stress protein n=1 Tax=Nocardia abscessus TaxID=120957 RepID=UPI0002EE24CF|nr:universal stress protein [Nocardia abscessus]MCC3331429.1 universal stress protein [Nocardia abscessus]
MTVRRPIVVGVDGSPASFAAIRWAAAMAARRHAPLHLVHAIGVPVHAMPVIGSLLFDISAYRQIGESALGQGRSIVGQLGGFPADVDVQTFLDLPTPVAALAARSATAQLLVIGARGLDPLERVLFGSVGVGLMKHADCPVAVIPAAADTAPPASHLPILVGVDGSRCSAHAVAIAFDEAASRAVGLVAVTTWPDRHDSPSTAQDRAEVLLEESLAGFTDKYPDVRVDRVVVEGRPAQRLLEASRTAQLVVLGSRGRGGVAGAALGSVSQTVLQSSRIPVLIAACRR